MTAQGNSGGDEADLDHTVARGAWFCAFAQMHGTVLEAVTLTAVTVVTVGRIL